jgi:hypothetical protein
VGERREPPWGQPLSPEALDPDRPGTLRCRPEWVRRAEARQLLIRVCDFFHSIDPVAKPSKEWAANYRLLGLGFTMLGLLVAGPLVGYFLGAWLDRKLGTSWLTFLCLLLGFIAAGRQIYLIARTLQREQG